MLDFLPECFNGKERHYCCPNTVLSVLKSACAVGCGVNKKTVVKAVNSKTSSKNGAQICRIHPAFLPLVSVRAELKGFLEL